MSTYNHTLSITLPANLADIAASISRALDPDSGGDKSWTASEDSLTISTSTPCTAEFYAQAQFMLLNPDALHAAVSADYAARWPDFTPSTLVECQAFCAGVIQPVEPVTQTV